MKENKKKSKTGGRRFLAVLGLVAIVAAFVAIAFVYVKLREVWLEQCVLTDVAAQVSITDGKMVRSDVIALEFGLRNGANLALIDFDERRAAVLKKIPNIRNITISRHLPDRVSIDVEERVPVARINIKGRKGDSGKVVDADGVVFISSSGTQMLPTIREAAPPGTPKGQSLSGQSLSALRLIEACRTSYPELAVIEADVSKPDYITTILARDYSTAQIAWDGMDSPSDAMMPGLHKQLKELSRTILSNVDRSVSVWHAEIPGKPITGDTRRGSL